MRAALLGYAFLSFVFAGLVDDKYIVPDSIKGGAALIAAACWRKDEK